MIQLHPANGPLRRVTFTLPADIHAREAGLVGEFLDESWNPCGHPMTQGADGRWRVTLELEAGRSYRFRYWVNGAEWRCDERCPQLPSPSGGHDSLLELPRPALVGQT